MTKPTCEVSTKKSGVMAGGNALKVTAAVGIAAPMQHAAHALHLNFMSLSR